MKTSCSYRSARLLPVRTSLALTLGLLGLSLVFMASLAYAQTGSISGTITYYGGAAPGTFHLNVDLFEAPEYSLAGDMNLSGSGPYTFDGLADGAYYLCVSVDLGPGSSPYTCYDSDGDGEPDPIVVAGGMAVTGIDIDVGGPWMPLGGPAVEGGQVNALAVTFPDTVYAAVAPVDAYDSGPSTIYKSTDRGDSWWAVHEPSHQVYALAVAGTRVYAGAFNPGGEGASIYASHDSGWTWTTVYTTGDRGAWLDISVHPADTDVAIVGGWHYHQDGEERVQSGLVYKTEDGGLTWTPILTDTPSGAEGGIISVLIHPTDPDLMLATAVHWGAPDQGNGYVWRSEDGGTNWISSTIPGVQFMSLVAHGSDPDMLYAGTTWSEWTQGPDRVYRSDDAGLTWEEVSSDAGGLLVFEPPSTVYAGPCPLWASASDGDPGTWTLVQDWCPGSQISFDIDLGLPPPALYRGGEWSGVSRSTDGGVNWSGANNGIETLVKPIDIDVDPQNPNKILVAAETQGGWMTTDGGQTWDQIFAWNMHTYAINPEDPDIVYSGRQDNDQGTVGRSEDGGLSFTRVYTPPFLLPGGSGGEESIGTLAIAPSRPDTVYAGGWDRPDWEDRQAIVVRSLDDGVSWSEVFTLPPESEVRVLTINPVDDEVVYAGGQDCSGPCQGFVYRTTDGGDSWDLTLVTTDTVRSIVIDPWRSDVVYVADQGYWVLKSDDGGDSWTVVKPPWWVPPNDPSGDILAIDPNVTSRVYLGGYGYIGETADGGMTWSAWDDPLNGNTPGMSPSALTVDRGKVTQTLYAGFSGVWAYSRPAPQPYRIYLPVVLRAYP